MTYDELNEFLGEITKLWPKFEDSADWKRIWMRAMRNYSADQANEALERYACRGRFSPKPSDITTLISQTAAVQEKNHADRLTTCLWILCVSNDVNPNRFGWAVPVLGQNGSNHKLAGELAQGHARTYGGRWDIYEPMTPLQVIELSAKIKNDAIANPGASV
jgi:hypothetical protein